MEMKLEIPEYKATDGLSNYWSPGFAISVGSSDNEVVIKANKAGLISLAVQLLTLAQDDAPVGSHYRYDDYSCLEDGSIGLVVEKIGE
jgi:hypothetical protein